MQKIISCIEKTSGLCNLESNLKRLPNYIIQKLITNIKKILVDYVIQNIKKKDIFLIQKFMG